MPKEILIIFVLLIMFLAGPPVAVYMFNLANDPIASHFTALPATLRLTGLLFWILDWSSIAVMIYLFLKRILSSR